MNLNKYFKTAQLTMQGQTNGGIIYLLPKIIVQISYLLPLMFIWKVIMSSGVDADMSTSQMLSYTYISVILTDLLVIRTAASSWNYEGLLINLYLRPLPIFGQLIFQALGSCIPMLILFSLPMLFIAPYFGIVIIPASLWFFPSLILCISLGFAIDFLFACLTIKLRGMSWLVYVIRMAIVSLFAGTVIPFKVMPFGLDKILAFQPFGSLGAAPLSIFTGIEEPFTIIILQLIWNIVLWPLAIIIFKKSQEGMISYGG